MPRFSEFDVSQLRRDTAVTDTEFPYAERGLTMIRVGADGQVEQAISTTEKRDLLGRLGRRDLLLGVWAGHWSSDCFSLDAAQTKAALGVPVSGAR